MNGYMISGKPITTTLVKQSNIQKQIKREKQRVVVKVIPHQAELDQVKAKYPQDFEIINDEVPVAFKVSVKPRDLETFPYDLEKLLLKVTLPESYPIQHMEIDVMNAEDEVPLAIKRQVLLFFIFSLTVLILLALIGIFLLKLKSERKRLTEANHNFWAC